MTRTFTYRAEFPYEEYRDEHGDYFRSLDDAMNHLSFSEEHIWSITEGEDDDGVTVYTYGPPTHYTNLIGFIGTAEPHNGVTYFEERLE